MSVGIGGDVPPARSRYFFTRGNWLLPEKEGEYTLCQFWNQLNLRLLEVHCAIVPLAMMIRNKRSVLQVPMCQHRSFNVHHGRVQRIPISRSTSGSGQLGIAT